MPIGVYNHLPLAEETKRKIGLSIRAFYKANPIREKRKSSPCSEETKRKISEAHKGLPSPMLGKHHSEATKVKLREIQKGEKSKEWKGENVSYNGLHKWLSKVLGKPSKCENCNKKGKKINGHWNIDWSNIDHKYRRIKEDYKSLCRKCHIEYDRDVLKVKIGRKKLET